MNKTGVILSEIREGKTINAIGKELDMRDSTIRAIVESLVHNGYLEEIRCESGCRLCSMNCGSLPSSKIKMYVVTDKGMDSIKWKTDENAVSM